jgi:CPA1 family monovalent cation:H+ antiporter
MPRTAGSVETPYLLAGALASIVLCALVAKRFELPYPIVFVVAGSAITFLPFVPAVTIDPQYIFLIVLPPLLFNGGWATDWRLFRANLRPILLLAIGLVFVTTFAVAWTAHAFGFGWAPAFVLGAIVSPPDAVAAGAIFERFSIPRRILAILDGEGLVNDGSALVIYRFAVVAAVTGAFSPGRAALAMIAVAVGGILVGLAVAWGVDAFTRALNRFELADSLINNLVFLLAPYAAYLGAEVIGVSGVLAAVVGGVFVSRRAAEIYGPQTRLIGSAVWNVLIYLLNGFVFLSIGLQLRSFVREPGFVAEHLAAGLGVSLTAIVVRLAWVFLATYVPRRLSRSLSRRDPAPSWRYTFVIGWTGLRGIVSLAGALALPLHDAAGQPFPDRDAIVFVAFCVIVVTLVGGGISLIPLLRWLRIDVDAEAAAQREVDVRVKALRAGLARLIELETGEHPPREWEIIGRLKQEYENRIDHLEGHLPGRQESTASQFDHGLQDEALLAERRAIMGMRADDQIPDDIFRRIEYDLDLAESRLR